MATYTMRARPVSQKITLVAAPLAVRPMNISPAAQKWNLVRSLPAPTALRLRICYANNLDSIDHLSAVEQPRLEVESQPIPFLNFARNLVLDAWNLVQNLWSLVQRIRLAAASIHASTESRSLEAEEQQVSPAPAPLQMLSDITDGGWGLITHLRQTLTDDSGTLEAKWRALESTARQQMGGLFVVTRASAEALDKLQSSSGDAAAVVERLWNQQSAAAVVEEEEALKRQVFAQVFAELNAQALRDGNNFVGYSAA